MEIVGSGDIEAPKQNGPTCVNKGISSGPCTVMLIVVSNAHPKLSIILNV